MHRLFFLPVSARLLRLLMLRRQATAYHFLNNWFSFSADLNFVEGCDAWFSFVLLVLIISLFVGSMLPLSGYVKFSC
jgi:hypothetical protein